MEGWQPILFSVTLLVAFRLLGAVPHCGTVTTPACPECPSPFTLNTFKNCVDCGATNQPSCMHENYVYYCCRPGPPPFPSTELTTTLGSGKQVKWFHTPRTPNAAPCEQPFGGCKPYAARQQALLALQPDRAAPLDCGFVYDSRCYDEILQQTAVNASCEAVAYTVNFGAYDPITPVNVGKPSEPTCYFMFIDRITLHMQKPELATLVQKQPFWNIVVVDHIPDSAQRTARTLKILAHRFFPHAKRSIYFDGKVLFATSVADVMRETLADAAWAVGGYELSSGRSPFTAVNATLRRLQPYVRQGKSTLRDLEDIHMYYHQIKLEKYEPQLGMVDCRMIVRQHTPEVQLLECAWFNELDLFSHREQLSFFHAVDTLGFRSLVKMFSRDLYVQKRTHINKEFIPRGIAVA